MHLMYGLPYKFPIIWILLVCCVIYCDIIITIRYDVFINLPFNMNNLFHAICYVNVYFIKFMISLNVKFSHVRSDILIYRNTFFMTLKKYLDSQDSLKFFVISCSLLKLLEACRSFKKNVQLCKKISKTLELIMLSYNITINLNK